MDTIDRTTIANDEELNVLISRFKSTTLFAMAFEFSNEDLFIRFLSAVGVNIDEFQEKYYYFNKSRNIHISQSENGYVWVSTMGLVAKAKYTKNNFVNACSGQKIVLQHLVEDAIALCDDESTYDVDSYNNELMESLSQALYSNISFYMELFSKAYLSIRGIKPPHTHKLEPLLASVKQVMRKRGHNNTIFHAVVIPILERTVNYLKTIPGEFNEAYIKYDDNSFDQTVIIFNADSLKDILDFIKVSDDIILELYYGSDLYLRAGLYQRLLQMCKTDEERDRIIKTYGFLKR